MQDNKLLAIMTKTLNKILIDLNKKSIITQYLNLNVGLLILLCFMYDINFVSNRMTKRLNQIYRKPVQYSITNIRSERNTIHFLTVPSTVS